MVGPLMETDDAYIGFGCPFCGTDVDFQAQYGGTVQTCPNCGETVVVPTEDRAAGKALPLPLESASLQLRRFLEDDAEDLAEYLSDEEVLNYLDHPPMQEMEVREWLRSVMRERLTSAGERLHLAIVLKEGGKVVGDVGIWLIDQDHLQASFDICLNRQFHGKGLALEASQAVLDFCFHGIGLHRVVTRCDGRNLPARKLLEKLGMRAEGEFVKSAKRRGEWVNTVWFALLKEEYK